MKKSFSSPSPSFQKLLYRQEYYIIKDGKTGFPIFVQLNPKFSLSPPAVSGILSSDLGGIRFLFGRSTP